MRTDLNPSWELLTQAVESLRVLESVDSTNTWAYENLLPAWGVVLTLNQSKGRGRWGREWELQPGRGVALSIGVPLSCEGSDVGLEHTWLPLVAGACLVRAMKLNGVAEVAVKWPNDVLVGSRKLAGILTEIDQRGQAIVGVGINVRPWDRELSRARISLDELVEVTSTTLDSILSSVILELRDAILLTPRETKTFVSSHLMTIGRGVEVLDQSGESWTGTAIGLDDFGSLLVRNEEGTVIPQRATEIHHLVQ